MFSYYRNTNILYCPPMSREYDNMRVNYFMGSRAAYVSSGYQRASTSLKRIQYPTAYILSGDVNLSFGQDDADPDNYSQNTLFENFSPAHNRRVNVLFADLHVRLYQRFVTNDMTFSYIKQGVDFDDVANY
jgi:prepilin-type processing-associated H-X9-DG protein